MDRGLVRDVDGLLRGRLERRLELLELPKCRAGLPARELLQRREHLLSLA